MRPLNILLKLLVALAGCLVVAFTAYDVLVFQSRRAEIAAIIANADPLERQPPATLVKLINVDMGDMIAQEAARKLLVDLGAAGRGSLAWQRDSALWWLLVRIHLSDQEQLAILCSRTWFGPRIRGFQSAAQQLIYRNLDALNPHELAKLVVIARLPRYFRRPESAADLEKASASLLVNAGMRLD